MISLEIILKNFVRFSDFLMISWEYIPQKQVISDCMSDLTKDSVEEK